MNKTQKDNYKDSENNTATIPGGFTVSKIDGEQNISTGLVIYDIPEDEIENVDWTTKNEDGAYNVQTLYNQFVWIPEVAESEYQRNLSYQSYYCINDDWILSETTPTNSTMTDTNYLPNVIQPKIDNETNNETAERNAVLKYNGFYIARYEAGNENSVAVSKQNASVYVIKTQEEFKIIGNEMYGNNSNYVKSAMCSGIQWDFVMSFIDGKQDAKGNEYNVRIESLTRHIGTVVEAGKNLNDKVQNIYDLEGNCVEYVAEKNDCKEFQFIGRGGSYYYGNIGNNASRRFAGVGVATQDRTFRPVLYII